MSAQRQALIQAGGRLAAHVTLGELTPERLCAESGLAPTAFSANFTSLTEYLVTLQQDFMDRLRAKIVAVTTGVPAGIRRTELAAETYLGACLSERALRAWLIEARAQPDVLAGLRQQNHIYWILIGIEFEALGWPHPRAAARLYLTMLNEASVIENRLGKRSNAVRLTVRNFLRNGNSVAS
ncbi:MAG: hypothetical protein M3O62_00790 [Pseudomonadota bacterium]|nr:hypothetical protein [Pseudomonadota bacterium]